MKPTLKRVLPALLAASMVLPVAGCKKRNTKEESSGTKEASTQSETETTPSENSAPGKVSIEMPDENYFRSIREQYEEAGYCLDDTVIGENGRYRNVNMTYVPDPFQTDMYVAFLFSEEGYDFMKTKEPLYSQMSLDAYRENMMNLYPKYKKILDDNFNLSRFPGERIAITTDPEFDLASMDLDKYMECLEEGFRIMTTDPTIKTEIEDTLNSKTISGDTVLEVRMHFSLDNKNDVVVSVDVVTCKQETTVDAQKTVAFGAELENTMLGVPYITTLHALSGFEEAAKKLYIQENLYTSYALREEVEAFSAEYGTNKQKVSDLPTGELICVEFQDVYKSRYYYYGEGKWAYTRELYGDVQTFEVTDKAANDKFVDEMLARLALIQLSPELRRAELITYDADSFYSEPKLSKEYKNANSQSVSYSLGYSTTWDFSVLREGEDLLYSEKETFRTTNNNDGIQESVYNDYYEYVQQGQEKYFRESAIQDLYREAADYQGRGSRYLLMQDPITDYSFEYGFTATDGEEHINCEVYSSEDCRMTLLLDKDGMPFAGWKWFAKAPWTEESGKNFLQKGLTLMTSIITQHVDTNMDQRFDDIKKNVVKTGQTGTSRSKEDVLREWLKENNLPDLDGTIVKGKTYKESPVVQAFRDHLEQHEDFTAEFWTWEEICLTQTSVSTKEQDFVYVESVRFYDFFDETYDSVWKTTGVELGMGNTEEIGDPGKNDHFWNTCNSCGVVRWPVALTIYKRDVFVQAYEATIDGEEYIIEEWGLRTGNARDEVDVIYFCKDGKIIGFKENEFDQMKTTYLTEFRDGTDESLFNVDAAGNT